MKKMVTLNKKEQRRLMVLNEVETDKMTSREAAEVSGLSPRHILVLDSGFGAAMPYNDEAASRKRHTQSKPGQYDKQLVHGVCLATHPGGVRVDIVNLGLCSTPA